MDPIKAEKLQAMNSYRKSQFVYNLLLHSLFALTCSLLCSFPFWFASLSSSMKCLFSMSLPNIWSSFLNPKCVFVVVNIIVVFLVGESKLLDASNSSPVADIYSEYVERSQSLKGQQESTLQEKKEERKLEAKEEKKLKDDQSSTVKSVEEDHEEVESKEDEVDDDEFEDCREEDVNINAEEDGRDIGEEDQESGLPAEELNKRVEEFIARVNKQRWLEELVYSDQISYN